MVDDARQVAVVAPVGDLIDADREKSLQALLVEALGDDALHDPPNRVPGDPQEPGDRGLGHLLRKPGGYVLEVARVTRAGPGPRHRLKAHAAVAAPEPA